MNKTFMAILIIAVIIIISLLYYFLIYAPSQNVVSSMEGAPCKVQGKLPGTIQNGVCVPKITEGSISL